MLDAFIEELRNLKNLTLRFYFSFDDLNPHTGEKIKKIVDIIEKEKLDLFLTFVPPCVFIPKGEVLNLFIFSQESPVFVFDHLGIKQALTHDDKEAILHSILYEKCVKCSHMLNRTCGGIHLRGFEEETNKKTHAWFYHYLENVSSGVIMDIGSGIIPHLNFYERLASENKKLVFVCLDPDKFLIKLMNNKINHREKIIQVCGFGEHLPFKKKSLDFVMMQGSYSHFLDLDAVLENVYKSLKGKGKLVILDSYEHGHASDKLDRFATHHRDHRLEEALVKIKEKGLAILDSFERKDVWGILAIKN
jgi:hypothetical protein